MSAISASVSRRRSASAALPAWIVQSDPACPVLSAISRSSASGPRTSPTIRRSGRIRSALRTSRRIVTSPRPSRFGGRASIRTTCGSRSRSSAASSIVTTRSAGSTNAASAPSVVVFPEPVPPQISSVQRARTARPRKSSSGGASVPAATSSRGVNPRGRKRRMVEHRPVERQRREHDVHARAVGQAGVAERLGLVRAPAERREDALDHVAQVALGGEADAGLREPAAPFHPHGRGAAHEDLVHGGIAQQRLERAEPDGALGHPGGERGPRAGVEHRGLALDERADAVAGVVAARGLARPVDEPAAQRVGQLVEGIAGAWSMPGIGPPGEDSPRARVRRYAAPARGERVDRSRRCAVLRGRDGGRSAHVNGGHRGGGFGGDGVPPTSYVRRHPVRTYDVGGRIRAQRRNRSSPPNDYDVGRHATPPGPAPSMPVLTFAEAAADARSLRR